MNGLIIATIGLLAIGISLALSPTSVLCKMGCHRWDFPGGKCEDCGVRDVFDEIDDEDTKDAPKSS